MEERFHLLAYGLAVVLVLIGLRMMLNDVYKVPVAWSLGITVAVLAASMLMSMRVPPKGARGGAYPFSPRRQGRATGR